MYLHIFQVIIADFVFLYFNGLIRISLPQAKLHTTKYDNTAKEPLHHCHDKPHETNPQCVL